MKWQCRDGKMRKWEWKWDVEIEEETVISYINYWIIIKLIHTYMRQKKKHFMFSAFIWTVLIANNPYIKLESKRMWIDSKRIDEEK